MSNLSYKKTASPSDNVDFGPLQDRFSDLLRAGSMRVSQAHSLFLQARQSALQELQALVETQIAAAAQALPVPLPINRLFAGKGLPEEKPREDFRPALKPMFDRRQLEAFATGSMADCFGVEFKVFEGKRIPRIPNGELMLFSRVMKITGIRHDFARVSEVEAEYDVPADAWFYRDNPSPDLPCSVYMEMAMQPCGFLSAYMGTSLLFPQQEFSFRNLDGEGTLLKPVDLHGKTLTSRARLLSTIVSSGVIIQKFDFELACDGETFYTGNATFGYFPPEAMAKQVGLDGGKAALPWLEQADRSAARAIEIPLRPAPERYTSTDAQRPGYRLSQGMLNFLDRVVLVENGGLHGRGYIYAARQIDPRDWFFACHFFQDPVMPGSLGIEAILQAMQVYALHFGLGKQLRSPRFGLLSGKPLVWKYRGQIVPAQKRMQIEIHLNQIEESPQRVVMDGSASLWADHVRIYEIDHATLVISEG